MNFLPLTPRDYPRLAPFFIRQKYRLSTYSLASLICWNNAVYRSCAAVTEDALLIRGEFLDGRQPPFLLMPISPDRQWVPEALHDLALDLGIESYWFVPGGYLRRFGRYPIADLFSIDEQPEYTDYVYLTEDLATLKGNRYSKKRNLINQFQRIYRATERVTVAPIESPAVPECIEFLEEWCLERDCDKDPTEDIACEKEAALKALEYADTIEMKGVLVRVDGVVSAIGMASRLTGDMGVLHFEKAFAAVKGLYQYLDQQCAQRLFCSTRYLNKESDMGIPGLAKAKKSYHPARLVRSYKLILK
jgi:hypothetical protein